jgi:hypothetical protein
MTEESQSSRETEWQNTDTNGQDALSLSTVERWTQRRLCSSLDHELGVEVYKTNFPAYIRAFHASRDVPPALSPDFVNRSQFHLFIAYMCVYALACDAFSVVDDSAEGGLSSNQLEYLIPTNSPRMIDPPESP